jgi:hypothetical protein
MFAGGLPEAYLEACSSFQSEDISELLPLCLSDSNFVSFVGKVEEQLKKLIAEDVD